LTAYLDGVGIDEHLASVSENGVIAYVTDHLGSVLNSATAGAAKAYAPFGEELTTAPQITSTSDPVMYGYAGRQFDSESGTYYYRARQYDPQVGRFLQKDPIGFGGGDVNLYRYVSGNPVRLIDPSGNCNLGTIITIGGGVISTSGSGSTAGSIVGGTLGAIVGGLLSGGNPWAIAGGSAIGSEIGSAFGGNYGSNGIPNTTIESGQTPTPQVVIPPYNPDSFPTPPPVTTVPTAFPNTSPNQPAISGTPL
jgi:RHS repeat-associated protein